METKERATAKEFYNTFQSAIWKNGNPNHIDEHVKECAKACCDKLCNEVVKDKERYDFFKAVRTEIDKL